MCRARSVQIIALATILIPSSRLWASTLSIAILLVKHGAEYNASDLMQRLLPTALATEFGQPPTERYTFHTKYKSRYSR